MRIYVTDIKLSGIKNIVEEIHFVFHNKITKKRFSLNSSNIKGLYGPNGAGKSAVIHAVKLYHNIINDKNYLNDKNNKLYVNELINHRTKLFKIEVSFVSYDSGTYDEDTQTYEIDSIARHSIEVSQDKNRELTITKEKFEKLKIPGNRSSKNVLVYEVTNGMLVDSILSEKTNIKSHNLLKSRSLVEIFAHDMLIEMVGEGNNINDPTQEDFLELWPLLVLSLRIVVVTESEDMHDTYLYRKALMTEKEDVVEAIKEKNKLAEVLPLSEHSIRVLKGDYESFLENIEKCTQFIRLFKPSLSRIEVEKKESKDSYIVERYFCYGEDRIHIEFESNGIKKLVNQFDTLTALSNGDNVFIDQFDANINDVYLIKLLEYFSSYGEGQLMFTTHNIGPMEILKDRKYSIDFISNKGLLTSWKKNGNYSVMNLYRNGMIENLPFNIDAFDFLGIFGEE